MAAILLVAGAAFMGIHVCYAQTAAFTAGSLLWTASVSVGVINYAYHYGDSEADLNAAQEITLPNRNPIYGSRRQFVMHLSLIAQTKSLVADYLNQLEASSNHNQERPAGATGANRFPPPPSAPPGDFNGQELANGMLRVS
mgnify:CR=1 FL=1